MPTRMSPRRVLLVTALLLSASCVYYNTMYDAKRAYDRAVEQRRAGQRVRANVEYDSVIARTGRLVTRHPDSKHAAPAALLKARAEIARDNRWEEAAETAAGVSDLTDDPRLLGIAAGLEGIARSRLDEFEDAERLLTRGLGAEPSDEDRALFHFYRGIIRLELGRPELAAEDLAEASRQERLTPEVRLDLARGLSDAGREEEAMRVTDELVREDRMGTFGGFGAAMDAHLDTLALRMPERLAAAFVEQLSEPDLTATKAALLQYYRGLSREESGDLDGAIATYDSARVLEGRYAAEADYRAARLRIVAASRPSDIVDTRRRLVRAASIPEPAVAAEASRLGGAVEEFANLVEAYETRGGSAAEAALRAAEIAGGQLGARRVARGLYLRYLDLAPDSRWHAKAIAGAMVHADWPAGEWADDRGAETDARLRTHLAGLPASDPYRVSLEDLPRNIESDSAYVDAERQLRRRLVEIRMLYDTTAVLVEPVADTTEAEDEDERPPDEGDVEF
jgi:tetratricopeptide (TPR) repeat protein